MRHGHHILSSVSLRMISFRSLTVIIRATLQALSVKPKVCALPQAVSAACSFLLCMSKLGVSRGPTWPSWSHGYTSLKSAKHGARSQAQRECWYRAAALQWAQDWDWNRRRFQFCLCHLQAVWSWAIMQVWEFCVLPIKEVMGLRLKSPFKE